MVCRFELCYLERFVWSGIAGLVADVSCGVGLSMILAKVFYI